VPFFLETHVNLSESAAHPAPNQLQSSEARRSFIMH
jgi:hypothetical protein